MLRPALVLFAGLLALVMLVAVSAASSLDCTETDCAAVLPGAERFEAQEEAPFFAGYDGRGELVGWVAKSTDLVDVQAYSGKPLVTLIGLDTRGIIVGTKLLKHSEPILLVGIPEQALHDFIGLYVGLPAITAVVVGTSSDENAVSVDIISGATVTVLAQNQTILKTARQVGMSAGVVDIAVVMPGHFVEEEVPWTWQELVDGRVFGRLIVTEHDMGKDEEGDFVALWYTIADAPQIGRAILGDRDYEHLMAQVEPGQHIFVVLGNGSSSFKGSAFVRGGIFDRVRVKQGLQELSFRDTDYKNLPALYAQGAPRFKEGAVFITRGGQLNPGAEFKLVFLGSLYSGAYSREFREFDSTHRLPRSVYELEAAPLDEAMYVQAWRNRFTDVLILGAYLIFVLGLFCFRRFMTANARRLWWLHVSVMTFGFAVVGLYMHAQPSVTQILTFFAALLGDVSWELFVSAPLIFILWIFISIGCIFWGRGVFCGWVCPYGAASELINKLAMRLGVRQFRIPKKLLYLRYLILVVLVLVFLLDPILGEQMAEVEPFKSSFLLVPWQRHWGLVAWWLLLVAAAIVIWRPFCRVLCPLGAGLALLSSFRFWGPKRRQFCSSCNICANACEPEAIRSDGTIDPRECLSCMECEMTYRDEQKCPPLVSIDRLKRKSEMQEQDLVQLKKMEQARKDL